MKYRQARRTTLFSIGCGLFLIGLIIGRLAGWGEVCMVSGASFVILKLFLHRYRYSFVIILFFVICFLLGVGRGAMFLQEVQQYQNYYKQPVEFTVIAREDANYSERRQLIFSASKIKASDGKKLVGNIEIEGFGVPMVYKGDEVKVEGKLYPKRGDNIAGISFAKMSLISRGESKIDELRRSFTVGLQNTLPEPLASLGIGILIGQRSGIPEGLNEQLKRVGLVHIVAVSGYNLTIFILFSQRILRKRSRFQATVIPGVLIMIFLMITGFSPSIVRASAVSGIGLLMWYFGRQIKPILLILLVASLTAGWNPLYIWSSVGWYLSFSAFFGILILSPLIHKHFVPHRLQKSSFLRLLSETIGAQVCTIPILLFIFQTFSVVSIVANLLVVPLIPFVMLATVVAGLYGMVGHFLFGGVIVLPARIMLGYIVETTDLLSKLPFATVKIQTSAWQTVVLATLIIMATVLLDRINRRKLTNKYLENIV